MTDNTEGTFATESEVAEEFAALMKGDQGAPEPDPVEEIAEADVDAASDIAAGETEGQSEQRPDRKIPFKVFDAERRRARAAEERVREQERQFAIAQERLNMLTAAYQQDQTPEAKPDVPPDPETDIFEYSKWQARQLEALQQTTKQFQESQAKEAQARQLEIHVATLERQFAEKAPDYVDAVKYVKDLRVRGYMAAGMSEPTAQARVMGEVQQFVQEQLHYGLNPVASAYEMAKAMGYTPKQAAAAAQAAQQARTETGQFAPQKSEKLDTVARAQQAHRSPTAANGAAAEGNGLSMKALAEMDNDEFEKLLPKLAKNNYAAFKALR